MASENVAAGTVAPSRPRAWLRAIVWIYLSPLLVVGVLLVVLFGLGLLAVVMGLIVEGLQHAGWH